MIKLFFILIGFISMCIFITYGFLLWATSSTYIGCQSNEELDEDVATRMGYKNYPFMDMYDE